MTLLFTFFFLALATSFLCSLLEASILAVPASYVASLEEQGSPAGIRLHRLTTQIDRALAAILTLNTVANTMGAVGVGGQVQKLFGVEWVTAFSIIMTLAILFISEIVPKTLGARYCRQLATFTSYAVTVMVIVLAPFVWMCQFISRLISPNDSAYPVTRDEVRSMAMLSHEHGSLGETEKRVIDNLLRLSNVRVKDIMTPRSVVYARPADMTVGEFIEPSNPIRFARIPIYGESIDDLKGVVHRYQVIDAYRRGETERKLGALVDPIHAVPENGRVAELLRQFMTRRTHLFQVVDEFGGTAGIVTLEDSIETLLGEEIVDETDSVEDMRDLARQLARQRRASREMEDPTTEEQT